MQRAFVQPSSRVPTLRRSIRVRSATTETKEAPAAPAAEATNEAPQAPGFAANQKLPTDGVYLKDIMNPKTGPAPELVNGRAAMVAVPFVVLTQIFYGKTILEQMQLGPNFAAMVAIICFTVAGSFAPAAMGVTASKVFPSENDPVADKPLEYFWTPLAEKINARAAMFGLGCLLVQDIIALVKGQ